MTKVLLAAAFLGLVACPAEARETRSRAVLRQFQLKHPCPSTMRTTGACPGYQKDHIMALECGGADAVWNLAWLTVAEHKTKTVWDNARCGRR